MKKLIISPHIDDEVLGCGGILDSDTFIAECGVDENRDIPGWGKITRSDRIAEIEKVCKLSGAKYVCLDNIVNQYNLYKLIGEIETIIDNQNPIEIYLPHPSYNQDHRVVYEAALTALRPHDVNYFVKRVFVYEQPHVLMWDWNYSKFVPQYFMEIDIEMKLKLYTECIPSQVREFRNPEMLKSMAYLRGKQSGYEYAEAYQILRWVK